MDYNTTQQQNMGSKQNDDFQDNMNNIKKSVQDTAQYAKAKAGEMFNQAQDKTNELQENLLVYIKENPMKAIGTAVLVGFFAGLIIRR